MSDETGTATATAVILSQDVIPIEAAAEDSTSTSTSTSTNRRGGGGNRGFIRAFRGGGGGNRDTSNINNNNNNNPNEKIVSTNSSSVEADGKNNTNTSSRGGRQNRNSLKGQDDGSTDNTNQVSSSLSSSSPSKGGTSGNISSTGKTLNTRRGRRANAENRPTGMRQGLSASLHGLKGGIGGIVNRGRGGGNRPGATNLTGDDDSHDNLQDTVDGNGSSNSPTRGDSSSNTRRGRNSSNGPKAFMTRSLSGMPTRSHNRNFREMLQETDEGNIEAAVLTTGTSKPFATTYSVEEQSTSDVSGVDYLNHDRTANASNNNHRRRTSAESHRSSLSSLNSSDDAGGGIPVVPTEGTMEPEVTNTGSSDALVEKVRRSSLVRNQQLESFRERRGSITKRRTSVGSIPEMKGIEKFDEDNNNSDDDDDEDDLANIVQNMYGGGTGGNDGVTSSSSRRSSNASQASGGEQLIESLHEARATRRTSIENLRVRRASLTSSEGGLQTKAGASSSNNDINTSANSGGSDDTYNVTNRSSGTLVETTRDTAPSSGTKESLIDNLRHFAETIEDDSLLQEESDYDSDDETEKHQTNTTAAAASYVQQQQQQQQRRRSINNKSPTNLTTSSSTTTIAEDEDFLTDIDQQTMAETCAMEHRIFLKAALDLLTERERLAVEASLQRDGPDRVIKSGIVKKSSQLMKGIWKVKYVEIKRGVFVYYDDDSSSSSSALSSCTTLASTSTIKNSSNNNNNNNPASQQSPSSSPVRKFIPLVSGEMKVRPVKLKKLAKAHNKNGYFFELSMLPDGPKRLWMTSTREERQSWMKAIDDATVGGSPATKSDAFSNCEYNNNDNGNNNNNNRTNSGVNENSPYRHCLDKYLAVQQQLKSAQTKQAYMGGLSILWRDPLRIPVQWIRIKMGNTIAVAEESGGYHAFHEEGTNQSIQQLWKDLVRDSVSINDNVIQGGDGHGPERILGALTKCILDYDETRFKMSGITSHTVRKKYQMNESQGISYACDILLACNRTRSAGDSYYSMDMLCRNPYLVVLCPVSSEALPLKIIVKLSNEDISSSEKKVHTSGPTKSWILLRGSDKKNNSWSKLFCILSEGVMSYYEKELPTPQKLKGQLILVGAKMGACTIVGDRAFVESDRTRKRLMKLIGESNISCNDINSSNFQQGGGRGGGNSNKGNNSSTWYMIGVVSKTGAKDVQLCFQNESDFSKWKDFIRSAIESSSNTNTSNNGISSSNKTKISNCKTMNASTLTENNNNSNNDDSGLDDDIEKGMDAAIKENRSKLTLGQPTVQVTVEASTAYRICTIDPQGDEDEDTWATIQTKFVQSFKLSGGSSGMITRGEEIVQMLLLRGSASNESFERVLKMKNKSNVVALEGLSMQKFAYRT